jgi:hypothetical protein
MTTKLWTKLWRHQVNNQLFQQKEQLAEEKLLPCPTSPAKTGKCGK